MSSLILQTFYVIYSRDADIQYCSLPKLIKLLCLGVQILNQWIANGAVVRKIGIREENSSSRSQLWSPMLLCSEASLQFSQGGFFFFCSDLNPFASRAGSAGDFNFLLWEEREAWHLHACSGPECLGKCKLNTVENVLFGVWGWKQSWGFWRDCLGQMAQCIPSLASNCSLLYNIQPFVLGYLR